MNPNILAVITNALTTRNSSRAATTPGDARDRRRVMREINPMVFKGL